MRTGWRRRLTGHVAGVLGILVVAYLVQRVVFVPEVPLWWRMVVTAAPLFAGVLLVQAVFRLGSKR